MNRADDATRCLIVAELGVNHDGDLACALEMTRAAAAAGADAIKLQYFHPDRLLSDDAVLAAYQAGTASDARALLAKLTLSLERVAEIIAQAKAAGLAAVVTPFSVADVEDLARLDSPSRVDWFKIASPDAVNPVLVAAVLRTGSPVLVSTGTCELAELEPLGEQLRDYRAAGREAVVLQCVSAYPTPEPDAALGGMRAIAEALGVPVGYSDHTSGLDTGALAVAAGARVIEKHFTHSRAAEGPDHAVSVDAAGLAEYVRNVRRAEAMMGPTAKRCLDVERDVRHVSRQSLCATRDLAAGHRLEASDLTVKRPGTGVPASAFEATIGRRLARPVAANRLLHEDDLEPASHRANP